MNLIPGSSGHSRLQTSRLKEEDRYQQSDTKNSNSQLFTFPVTATAHALILCRAVSGGEWAGLGSRGPIESERPRPPGRWTQLDPGSGRRRRGQSDGSGGGGAWGLEAEPRAVSPALAAASTAAAATVLCLLWPRWLPALLLAACRPGIPSHLPSRWPGAQVRLAALLRPRVLLGIFQSRGRPLRAVSAPLLPGPPGGGPGGRDDSLPIPPPPFQAPRLSPGSWGQASSFPCG